MKTMKTGISVIDKVLPRGLSKTKVNVFGTKCGSGKTILACMVATNYAKAGKSVLYLTQEQNEKTIIEKMYRVIFGHSGYNDKMIADVKKYYGDIVIKQLPYNLLDNAKIIDTINSYNKKFDLVVLDYIYMETPLSNQTYMEDVNKQIKTTILFTHNVNSFISNTNDLKVINTSRLNGKNNIFVFDVEHNEYGYKTGPVLLNRKNIGNISYNIFGEVKNN